LTTIKYGKNVAVKINKKVSSNTKKLTGSIYPIGSNLGGGYFASQSNIDLLKNNIKQLLATEKGERVMLPNYGLALRKFLFQPLDAATFEDIKEEVIVNISKYLPNIEIIKIGVFETGSVNIQGISGLVIKLIAKAKNIPQEIVDVQVKIG